MSINLELSNRTKTNHDLVLKIVKLTKKSCVLRTKIQYCLHKRSNEIINNWIKNVHSNDSHHKYEKMGYFAEIDSDSDFKNISWLNRKRIVRLQSYGSQINQLNKLLDKLLESELKKEKTR